jgi:hypothetical protein
MGRAADRRLRCVSSACEELVAEGPYFFADLADTSEAEERAAIDAGLIQASGIRYAASRA